MDKITVVDFVVDHVLVSQAGFTPITNRIIENFKEKAKEIKITKPKDVTGPEVASI